MSLHRHESTAEAPRADEDNNRLRDLESRNTCLELELQQLRSEDSISQLARASARIAGLEAALESQTRCREYLEQEVEMLKQSERERRISELEAELVHAAKRREDLERQIILIANAPCSVGGCYGIFK